MIGFSKFKTNGKEVLTKEQLWDVRCVVELRLSDERQKYWEFYEKDIISISVGVHSITNRFIILATRVRNNEDITKHTTVYHKIDRKVMRSYKIMAQKLRLGTCEDYRRSLMSETDLTKEFEVYWDDLTEDAKEKFKVFDHENVGITPIAIIDIEDTDEIEKLEKEND